MARQHQLQPGALQHTMCFPGLQSWRLMATKRQNPEEDEELDRLMRIPAQRSFFLHSKRGRAIADRAERSRAQRHEALWAKVQRAEAQLSISMTDIPKRKRALERIYADLVAENAYNLTSSINSLREMYSATDQRDLIRLLEEEARRTKAYQEAKWRSVSLYLFAPPGDVGFLRRLGKLLGFIGLIPLFLLDNFMAVAVFFARKYHDSQLKTIAQMRSPKQAGEKRATQRMQIRSNLLQDPAKVSHGGYERSDFDGTRGWCSG